MQTLPPNFAPCRRRGLTFIELMFATMILGVGVIIIATAFPVAISQQRASVDQTTSSTIERSAARTLQTSASVAPPATGWLNDTNALVTVVGTVKNVRGDISSLDDAGANSDWKRISGDMVYRADPRYAWTTLYTRPDVNPAGPPDNNQVTFFIFTMASREKAEFESTPAELDRLKPTKIQIKYYYKGNKDPALNVDPEEDTIEIKDGNIAGSVATCVEGAYVIRGEGVLISSSLFPQNAMIKLGTQFESSEMSDQSARRFRIAPGFTLNNSKNEDPATEVTAAFRVAWAVGAEMPAVAGTPTPNRVLSCRPVQFNIPDPG